MLSHPFWKRRYGGDPAIVGKTIWLDARPYTVIGVLPPSFVYLSKMMAEPIRCGRRSIMRLRLRC